LSCYGTGSKTAPVLTSATSGNGAITVKGTVTGTPGATITLESLAAARSVAGEEAVRQEPPVAPGRRAAGVCRKEQKP